MRALLPLVLILAATPVAAAPSRSQEERLAKALAGRVAGQPVNCLWQRQIRSSHVYDRTAILYETNDGTYYLNRPSSGATFLNSSDILVTDTHTDQLCSIDTVHLVDNTTGMHGGSVGLGKFVPYPRPGRTK